MERGGASRAFPHPLPAVRARALGINTAASSAAAAGVPDGGVRAFEGSVGFPGGGGSPGPSGRLVSSPLLRWNQRAGQALRRPGRSAGVFPPRALGPGLLPA